MAMPIGPTPVLEDEEAIRFLEKVEREESQKVSLKSTPKLEALRLRIVANAERSEK